MIISLFDFDCTMSLCSPLISYSEGSSTCSRHHDVSLEFRVFMADPENKSLEEKSILIQEKRTLRFCFKGDTPKTVDRTKNAYDFFLELVNPETFPKGTACATG